MNTLTGAILALVSAFTWGTADFAGGLAARRTHPFQVLLVSAPAGIVMLLILAVAQQEPWPSAGDMAWAASAGLSGALGIASLYRGLATGSAAIVAPTAGVLTATLPVAFSIITGGWPRPVQLAGFAVAAAGIWLVASGSGDTRSRTAGLVSALLAGVGLGALLILIAQVNEALIFGPLAVARAATMLTASVLVAAAGIPRLARAALPLAMVAGLLDAGGTVFYLMARQHVGLDVAAVLSSFYPVATVALSRLVLKETVSRSQWVGAAACLAAIGLITG